MLDAEVVLHDLLDDKIAELKSDLSIADQIFDGWPVERIENVKKWIANTKIKTIYNHPRDDADLPSYCIVLVSASESEQVIGSSGDQISEIQLSTMEDGWIGSDSDILRANILLPTSLTQMYSSLEVKDGRRSCHVAANAHTSLNKGIWIDFTNSVLEGGYVSLVDMNYVTFLIKSCPTIDRIDPILGQMVNESARVGTFLSFGFGEKAHEEHTFPFTITTKNLWERIRIDISGVPNRDKDRLRYMDFKIVNDDSYINIYVDRLMGEKSLGSVLEEVYLDTSCRIESWSNNADLTQILYQIALWNLLKYRTYLEKSWGLMEQRVEGGDVMPQPEFYPEFVYVRGLTYSCKSIELIPRESDLEVLEVNLGKEDWGGK